MPRLIDADAWDSELMLYGFGQAIIGRKIKYTVGEVRSALAKQPTVDAVEVVRCKDCKHWQCDDYDSYCDELGIYDTDMNSYCSYANRREK